MLPQRSARPGPSQPRPLPPPALPAPVGPASLSTARSATAHPAKHPHALYDTPACTIPRPGRSHRKVVRRAGRVRRLAGQLGGLRGALSQAFPHVIRQHGHRAAAPLQQRARERHCACRLACRRCKHESARQRALATSHSPVEASSFSKPACALRTLAAPRTGGGAGARNRCPGDPASPAAAPRSRLSKRVSQAVGLLQGRAAQPGDAPGRPSPAPCAAGGPRWRGGMPPDPPPEPCRTGAGGDMRPGCLAGLPDR